MADIDGVLEPCGCTSRPQGGIDRLAAMTQQLRNAAPSLVLAAGKIFDASGANAPVDSRALQQQWKADALGVALARIGIDIAVPDPSDLARAAPRLEALARESPGMTLVTAAAAAKRAGSHVVGFTAAWLREDDPAAIAAALAALARDCERLRREGADVVVATIGGPLSPERGAEAIGADIVVVTGQETASVVEHAGALIVRAGRHTEQLVALDLWPARTESRGWTLREDSRRAGPGRVSERQAEALVRPLGQSAPADPAIRTLLDQLFVRINAHHRQAQTAEPAKPGAPATRRSPSYVGSRTCAACHTDAYFWWLQTHHGRAFRSLEARHRELDLDCIGCHVTGYGEPGGASLARIAELEGVGCESCHGPGERHADNPRAPHKELQREVPERRCRTCHDPEHSDRFEYDAARVALHAAGHRVSATP